MRYDTLLKGKDREVGGDESNSKSQTDDEIERKTNDFEKRREEKDSLEISYPIDLLSISHFLSGGHAIIL